jgi:predicted alpha/beta-hydrolase family hydrolase
LGKARLLKQIGELAIDGPKNADRTITLAHGAGAAMDTPFMAFFATALADRRFRVVRFEFPYMAAKRLTGKSKPPDREPILRETWLKVIEKVGADGHVIGGKSMSGRIASLVADEAGVAGLVCLGYPFHPVGKGHDYQTIQKQRSDGKDLSFDCTVSVKDNRDDGLGRSGKEGPEDFLQRRVVSGGDH